MTTSVLSVTVEVKHMLWAEMWPRVIVDFSLVCPWPPRTSCWVEEGIVLQLIRSHKTWGLNLKKKKASLWTSFFLSFEGGEWAYVPDKGENLILLPTNPLLLLFGARDAGALQVTSWRRAQTKSKQVVMEKVETTTVKTKRGHLEHQTLLSKTQLLFSIKLNEKIQKDFQKRWQHDHTNQTSISQNLLSWRFRPLSPFSQSWSQRLLLRAVSICVCRAFLGRMLVSDCSGTDGRSRRSACCWSCSRSFLPGQQENSMRACGQSHCKNCILRGFSRKKKSNFCFVRKQ